MAFLVIFLVLALFLPLILLLIPLAIALFGLSAPSDSTRNSSLAE